MSRVDLLHSLRSQLPSPSRRGEIDCDRARRLLDDYLEYRLRKRDRRLFETHIAGCPRCAPWYAHELRARPALEHHLRLALGASVRSVSLSPAAGARITQSAQASVRRGIWLNRAMIAGRLLAGAVSAILLAAGLVYLLNWVWRLPQATTTPAGTGEILSSSQGTQPLPAPAGVAWDGVLEPGELFPGESFAPAQLLVDAPSGQSQPLTYGLLLFEPGLLQTGQAFTTTLLVRNEQDQPFPVSQVNLDIEGPQRSYHFELAVSDPLPAERVSALRITPGSLAEASQERYQVSPDQIIDTPGVYTIRVTLFHAVTVPAP